MSMGLKKTLAVILSVIMVIGISVGTVIIMNKQILTLLIALSITLAFAVGAFFIPTAKKLKIFVDKFAQLWYYITVTAQERFVKSAFAAPELASLG